MKVVYTLSNRKPLFSQCLKSIRTLSSFVDKRDIQIFYTPPRSRRGEGKLRRIAEVIKAPNITKPFVFDRARGFGRYGEKIHLCEVKDSEVIFLDCDTLIKKDLTELLDFKYDISARIGEPLNSEIDLYKWQEIAQARNKFPIPILNTGFLIFMDRAHHKIKDEWLRFQNEELPNPHPRNYLKDQYAFSLAVSQGYTLRFMERDEHAFVWLDEENEDTYVLHGYDRGLLKRAITKTTGWYLP